MLYLRGVFMTKKTLRILRPAILVGIGLTLALLGASVNSTGSRADLEAVALLQAATATASTDTSVPGSTDWITLMGLLIVAIVMLPLLLRRSTWNRN